MTHRINTSETQIDTSPSTMLGHDYGTILLIHEGDYNTRQLRSHERDGYDGRNIGGIATVSPGTNGAGAIETVTVTSGQNIGLADGTYNSIGTLSDTSVRGSGSAFDIVISNSGATVAATVNTPGSLYKYGDTVTLSGADFDSTEGNDIVLTVSGLYNQPVTLEMRYQVQKLRAGSYTLNHGYEGQIMYFTPREQSTETAWDPQHCSVTVARARTWSQQSVGEYDNLKWFPFEGDDGGYGSTLVHLMYIEGAWVASGGTWD